MPRDRRAVVIATHAVPVLGVSDVDAAVAYYVDVLGFTVDEDGVFGVGDEGSVYGIVHLGEASIHLQRRATEAPTDRDRFETDAYFYVLDADELHERFTSAGVTIIRPIDDSAYGLRDFQIEDPFGLRLAFGSPLL